MPGQEREECAHLYPSSAGTHLPPSTGVVWANTLPWFTMVAIVSIAAILLLDKHKPGIKMNPRYKDK